MATEPAITSENAHAYHRGCPFLGAEDDLETKFLFATLEGCCHRAKPVEAVIMAHQQTYCLTPQFTKCPVYLQTTPGSLPAELRQPLEQGTSRRWLGITAVIGLLVIAGLLFTVFGGGLSAVNQQLRGIFGVPTAVAIVPSTSTATATSTQTATPSATTTLTPLLSDTASPTNTSSPSPSATATQRPSTATATVELETDTPEPTPTQTVTVEPATPTSAPTATPTQTATPIPSSTTPTVTATATPVLPVQAVIAANRVNIRSGPSIAYPVLEIVVEGDEFEVIGRLQDNSWWQICCATDGQPAWVFSEAVTIEGDVATIPIVVEIPTPPSTSQ